MTIQPCFVGIDIGGTKILGGLSTAKGELLGQHKLSTPAGADVKDITNLVAKLVKTLTLQADLPQKSICGIGIAIPGIVDNSGQIIATPNLRLGQVDLKMILERKLRTKVSLGNDVNLGVLGERWLGAARKATNVVGIFPGTGIGGGVIIRNEFLTGTQGAAAEIGHMLVDPAGPPCSCGNQGCLEALAGRWAIERDIRAALKKGEKSVITDLAGKNLERIKSSSLAKAIQAKDALTLRVMEQACAALGRACVSLNHVFNPDMFLFGGGMIEACGDFILPRVEKALRSDPFFKKLNAPRVTAAKLGDEAVLLGAVALALRNSGQQELGTLSYPLVKTAGGGKIIVKGQSVNRTSFIRADGKIREPEDILSSTLSDKDLANICRKGPEVLFIGLVRKNAAKVSAKGVRYLRKKRILLKIFPVAQAVRAYNASTDRKTLLFIF